MMKNTLKSLFVFLQLALLFVLATSCSDEFVKGTYSASLHHYSLNVDTKELNSISYSNGVCKINVETYPTVMWQIVGLPEWLSTPNADGQGSKEVLFNVTENPSLTEKRAHVFNIITTNSDWQTSLPIYAVQEKKAKELKVSPIPPSTLFPTADGGEINLDVSANIPWHIECEEDFVSFPKEKGNGTEKIMIMVKQWSALDVVTERVAYVYFMDDIDGEVQQVITISQTPLQTTVVTQNETCEFDCLSSTKQLVLGDVQGGYSVKTSSEWLHVTENTTSGQVSLDINADDNYQDEARTGHVYVYTEDGSILYDICATQSGRELSAVTLEEKFEAVGGSAEVAVKTFGDWACSTDDSWIMAVRKDNVCMINVEESFSMFRRDGIVRINKLDDKGCPVGKTVEIDVAQKGKYMSMDVENLVFGPDESTQSIKLSTDATWFARTDSDWIELSTTSGKGNEEIQVTVKTYEGQEDRVGSISIQSCDKDYAIRVVQKSAYLNTSESSITLSPLGGRMSLSFQSNTNWFITCDAAWLQVSQTEGQGDAEVFLEFSENTTDESRTCEVKICSLSGTSILIVSQPPHSLVCEPNSLQFESENSSKNINVMSSYGDYDCSTTSSWITLSKMANNCLKVTVSENATLQVREGTIIISAKDKTITVPVSQKPTPKLTVSRNDVTVSPDGETVNVSYTATDDIKLSTTDSWLTVSKTAGNISIKASKNTGLEKRTGKVIITMGNLSQTIVVTQFANPVIKLSKGYASFTYSGGSETITITSNCTYKVTTSATWITTSVKGDIMTVNASFNSNRQSRSGYVYVTSTQDSSVKATVNVSQAGY